MKRNLLFTAILLIGMAFTSCKMHQFGYVTTYLDFTPYSEQGFFLTELESVPFDYVPVGTISVTEYSGQDAVYYNQTHPKSKVYDDDLYYKAEKSKVSKDWRFASAESAIKELVEKSKRAGGNGLVALKTVTTVDTKSNLVVSVTVSGMIINRK